VVNRNCISPNLLIDTAAGSATRDVLGGGGVNGKHTESGMLHTSPLCTQQAVPLLMITEIPDLTPDSTTAVSLNLF
jgi:hypothetical protein